MTILPLQRKLKVAVVTNYFPTSVQPWAGHSAYQTLLKLAEDCDVQVFYPESTYPQWMTPKSRTYASLDPDYEVPGIKTRYLQFSAMPYISRPLNGYMAANSLYEPVRMFGPDVILSYVVYPDGFAAVRVARRLRVPVVVTSIGSDLNRISGSLVRLMTKHALSSADAVVTVSRDLLATARRLGASESRSHAILNGCDTTTFFPKNRNMARCSLQIPLSHKMVLYVGRFDLRKGLIELIEAFTALQHRCPGVHCYIVGEGPDKARLCSAVELCGIAAHVTLVPSCTTEQVATWIAASDLLTLPSYKEGCPNVILEALCSGRPVVTTDVGGIPELMDGQSGELVKPGVVDTLAQALENVLSRQWDADALARKHHRPWKQVSDELLNVLNGVVEASQQ